MENKQIGFFVVPFPDGSTLKAYFSGGAGLHGPGTEAAVSALEARESVVGAKGFYDEQYDGDQYSHYGAGAAHPVEESLRAFIERHGLSGAKCLEVGCGRGKLQDVVDDYTGIDFSDSAGQYHRKAFVQGSAEALPFEDNSFDAAWTVWVFEHVPDIEKAMAELRRVIRPGGYLYFYPAWQCRPWAAEGYPVRPYSDFGLAGKLVKASIPVRESLAWRGPKMLARRIGRKARAMGEAGGTRLRVKALRANFDHFWMADSDAMHSIDPYETILWFTSRGDECLSHPTPRSRFLVRGGAQTFRIA